MRRQLNPVEQARAQFYDRMRREGWRAWVDHPPPDQPVQVIHFPWRSGVVMSPRHTSPELDITDYYWRPLP